MTHATGAQPDIQTLEKALACVIEGLETDQLLIRFWSIDPNRPEREFTFVLDVGGSGYKGEGIQPVRCLLCLML